LFSGSSQGLGITASIFHSAKPLLRSLSIAQPLFPYKYTRHQVDRNLRYFCIALLLWGAGDMALVAVLLVIGSGKLCIKQKDEREPSKMVGELEPLASC